jgi:protein-tyrosine-phosphatase
VSAQSGIDIRDHTSQPATRELLQQSDLIFGLAAEHVDYVLSQGIPADKVFLLRAFPERPSNWRDLSIIDPIGQGDDVYMQVFFQIDEAIHHALPEIIARAKERARSQER